MSQKGHVSLWLLKNLEETLRPEGSENIPILLQEIDLYFSNQNDPRNPKMGSKQSVVAPPTNDFFKKLFFGEKNVKKIGNFVDFWIFMATYMDKLDQFKKI